MLAERAAVTADKFSRKQLVDTIGSLSRLGNHIAKHSQHKAVQVLLDQWLTGHVASPSDTVPAHVVKLAVSLTNIADFLGSKRELRTETFISAAVEWACTAAKPETGALSAEDLVVLLWAVKELTPLGLRPHSELLATALPRLRDEGKFSTYSMLRLIQASEVLLAARHALGKADEALVVPVVNALTEAVANKCPPETLAQIVALWDRAGDAFWASAPALAEAVVAKTVALTEDASVSAVDLHRLLDTLVSSSFSRSQAFASSRSILWRAASARRDSREVALATTIEKIALGPKHGSTVPPPVTTSSVVASAEVNSYEDGTGPNHELWHRQPLLLEPSALAERLVALCRHDAPDSEVITASDMLTGVLDSLKAGEVVPLLDTVMSGVQRRLARTPALLEVIERLGDVIVAHTEELSTLHLTGALSSFANMGLPYHLLFEAVLLAVLERHRLNAQNLSWGQVVGVLEAFAAVRLRIPELASLYSHLRQPRELARLPTMALIRFLSASSRLELVQDVQGDVGEILERILAETTQHRPLPLESCVVLVQSFLLTGTIPLDKHIRHLLSWIAQARVVQLTPQQVQVLRQYILFLLAQPDVQARGCILRLPSEVQRFAGGLLRHRAPAWTHATSDTTRRFRQEVKESLQASPLDTIENSLDTISLGPAGNFDMHVNGCGWLLDGPESFFRPFTSGLRHTPHERQRAWLLSRLVADEDTRICVADFLPAATTWPKMESVERLSWLKWGQAPVNTRPSLLGFDAPA